MERRRTAFIARTRAVMAAYAGKGAFLFGKTALQVMGVAIGFLRRRQPLLSLDTMNAALASYARRQGVARVAEAMKWVRAGTDSLYETITRLVLVHAGLPEPTVNLEVHCPSSGMTYHLDMGYDKEKVGVEYDGAVHVGDRTQMEIDANRRRILQDEGSPYV